jgi:hypothetical protein
MLINKTQEIERLIKAFELEADKYHDIEFHTYLIRQEGLSGIERKFRKPNHAIMLWQYIGQLGNENALKNFENNLKESDLKWGIRGAQLTKYGVIEGAGTDHFLRMAKRAAGLFSEEESMTFKSRVVNEIQTEELKNNPKSKPTTAVNDNPLAVWLNYLLYYLSRTYPNREYSTRIEPDLFTLSLLALEQFADESAIGKSDRSNTNLSDINFRVSVSFPGEKRRYVSRVVDILRKQLPTDSVFYDLDYQAQIARPNADILLQNIYHKQSELIVVFLCKEYSKKEWCGLEWRGIRDLIKSKHDEKIMFVKFDKAEIDGTFTIDGYIDGSKYKTQEVANFILARLKT